MPTTPLARSTMVRYTHPPTHVCLSAGEAINPRNLSVFERWTNVGKFYSKQLDREDMYDDHFLAAQAVGAQNNGKGAV